jgi:hypothetical protein
LAPSFGRQPTEEHVTVESRSTRTVAIGAAIALAVAGGGAAYAAATNSDPRDALLRDAAQRLNVTPGELRSALEGAFGDQLDQAVKDGRLTQAQADELKQRIRRFGLPLGGPMGGAGGPGPGFAFGFRGPGGPGPLGAGLDAAASYLGLTQAQLTRELRDGRTLAEVARAQGKSVDGLEQALVDAARSRLDRAVADRQLTSEQRDQILSEIQQHVDDLVTSGFTGCGCASPMSMSAPTFHEASFNREQLACERLRPRGRRTHVPPGREIDPRDADPPPSHPRHVVEHDCAPTSSRRKYGRSCALAKPASCDELFRRTSSRRSTRASLNRPKKRSAVVCVKPIV